MPVFSPWRRQWHPTPALLPGKSQGQRSLVGCRLWGRRVGHDWSDLAAAAAAFSQSVAQSCPTLCDPMNRSTPGLPVHHQLPVLSAPIKTFNSAVESALLHNLYFIAHTCRCTLFYHTVETAQNQLCYFYFASHFIYILYLWLTLDFTKEGLKRNETRISPIFPSPSLSSFSKLCGWLIKS